uniref:Protein kinase domain-containing protein n=1 Tax=Aegilops tauschii subsp. strangulata TaxID=200361 RepID=A0A453EZF7_AEGTS
ECNLQYGNNRIATQLTYLQLQDLVARNADHSKASLADLLYGLLRFEPSERLTAQEALDHPFFRIPGPT